MDSKKERCTERLCVRGPAARVRDGQSGGHLPRVGRRRPLARPLPRSTCFHMCLHLYTYIHIYIHLYIFIYVYMYIYICIHICWWTSGASARRSRWKTPTTSGTTPTTCLPSPALSPVAVRPSQRRARERERERETQREKAPLMDRAHVTGQGHLESCQECQARSVSKRVCSVRLSMYAASSSKCFEKGVQCQAAHVCCVCP